MREIADSVDAVLMVDMAHFSGLVAGKVLLKNMTLSPMPISLRRQRINLYEDLVVESYFPMARISRSH